MTQANRDGSGRQRRGRAGRTALGVALLYAALGATWIVASDVIAGEPVWRFGTQTVKGLAYVAVTAAWVWWLAARALRGEAAATEAVSAKDDQLLRVVQAMPVLMDAVDEQGRIIAWNDECARVTGYSAEEIVGNGRAWELLYPDAEYRERMRRELAERRACYTDWEWELTTKSGERRTIAWSNQSDRFPIKGWAAWGVGVDVTNRRRAESAVQEWKERYEAAVWASGHIIYDWDSPTDHVVWAGDAPGVLGITPEEIGDIPQWLERIHPDDRSSATDEIDRVIRTGEPFVLEYRMRRADGTYASVRDRGRFVPEPGGSRKRMVGIIADISEAAESRERLHESERRLRATFDALAEGLLVTDGEGRIVEANPSSARILQVPPEAIVGLSVFDPSWVTYREDGSIMPHDEYPVSVVLRTGRGVVGVVMGVAVPRGERRWISINAEPLPDHTSGAAAGTVVSFVDITERRAVERRYSSLVSLLPDGVIVHQDGKVMFANDAANAAITGDESRSVVGRSILEMVHDADRPVIAGRTREMIERGEPQGRREVRVIRDDGSILEGETAAARIEFEGRPAVLAVIRDVSDRKKAEADLERTLDTLRRERALFVGGPAVVWNWRNAPGWPVEYVSPNVSQLGYSAEDFTSGRIAFADIAHPDDLARVGKEVAEHAAAGDASFEQEYRIRTASGEYRVMYDFTTVVRNERGEVTHFHGYTLDITARQQAEAALRKSESTLRALLDAIPDLLFRLGSDGRYLDYHASEGSKLLVPPEQFLGRRPSEVLPPHVAEPTEKTLAAVLADGRPRMFEYSTRPLYPDSRAMGAEFEVRIVRASAGDAVALVREITDRKRAERLREGQNRVLERLASGAPLDDVLTDLVHVIEDQDPEMLASVLLLEPDGQHVRTAAAPSLPREYIAMVDRITIGPDVGSCGTAMALKRRVITEDVATDPKWTAARDVTTAHGLRACWSEPIIGGNGAVLGSFAMYYRTPRTPRKEHLDLIASAAHLAGVTIERRRSEAALRESEERSRRLIETLPVGVLVHQAGHFVLANPAAARMLRTPSEAVVGRPILEIVHPDSRAAVEQRVRGLAAPGSTNPIALQKWLRRDGTPFDVEATGTAITLAGRPAVVVAAMDVSERRRAERRQQLMMAELDHRVKNNLAAVISLAEQTGRTSPDIATFQRNFIVRIRAMARLHQALARGHWEGVELSNLAAQTLGAFVPDESGRFSLDGPEVTLPARAASSLAMALNELATNAVKYGALSVQSGRVELRWSVTPATGGAPPVLLLNWQERGGPRVVPPASRGFGVDLVEQGLAYELRGNAEVHFEPDGVHCRMEVPLEEEDSPQDGDGRL